MTTTSPVLKQIAGLPKLSHAELKALWRECFGVEPPAYRRGFLVRGLAHRIQERACSRIWNGFWLRPESCSTWSTGCCLIWGVCEPTVACRARRASGQATARPAQPGECDQGLRRAPVGGIPRVRRRKRACGPG